MNSFHVKRLEIGKLQYEIYLRDEMKHYMYTCLMGLHWNAGLIRYSLEGPILICCRRLTHTHTHHKTCNVGDACVCMCVLSVGWQPTIDLPYCQSGHDSPWHHYDTSDTLPWHPLPTLASVLITNLFIYYYYFLSVISLLLHKRNCINNCINNCLCIFGRVNARELRMSLQLSQVKNSMFDELEVSVRGAYQLFRGLLVTIGGTDKVQAMSLPPLLIGWALVLCRCPGILRIAMKLKVVVSVAILCQSELTCRDVFNTQSKL